MPIRNGCLAAATFLGLALAAQPALAGVGVTTVIDFEGPTLAGLYLPGESMMVGGFQLTARVDFGLVDGASALGLSAPVGSSGQFYFASNEGQLEITRPDGLPFQLSSFSAAFVPLDPPSLQRTAIYVTAQLAGGGTSTAGWIFPEASTGLHPFSSYTLPAGWDNLASVSFRACSAVGMGFCLEPLMNNGQFAIDNISLTPVPEPASGALLALGAAALALRLRHQARKHA